jgi:hypothetical protein
MINTLCFGSPHLKNTPTALHSKKRLWDAADQSRANPGLHPRNIQRLFLASSPTFRRGPFFCLKEN